MATHSLTLNFGGVHHLAQILATPGLLTDVGDLYRAGEILEEKLTDLPKPAEFREKVDQLEGEKIIRAWQRSSEFVLELSERQRDTCKKALSEIIKKGIGAGPAANCLIKQFGLAPEDG